ncbi:MAG: PAS domain S-box protein [Gammaproteobacteria bacterium]|nr:PAS domain S-box protein [Gammaproteobacteria bacterium]
MVHHSAVHTSRHDREPSSDPATVADQAIPASGLDLPLELVLDNTIVGISYMRQRRFIWTNVRMAEIYGYAPGELTGRSVRDLYATEEDYREVGRMYATLSTNRFYTHERPMVRKNGELIWCLISGRMVDSSGADSASIWVVQDITDRKHVEDQIRRANLRLEQTVERRTLNLRRSYETLQREIERRQAAQLASADTRQKYRALFTHIPLGVLVISEEGEVIEANGTVQTCLAASTRRDLHQLIQDPSRAIVGDGCTSLAGIIRQHLPVDRRRVERFEVIWRSNRGIRYLSAVAAALARHGLGAVVVFQDETTQRLALQREQEQHQALAHASRVSLMSQMAMTMAHDLGQPLSACQSYVMGLRHRFAGELRERPELAHAVDRIAMHLDEAGSIIANARSFLSRHTREFETVDLAELARKTLDLLEIQLRSAGVQAIVESAELVPLARGRPTELQHVLANLVVNAIEAMASVPSGSRQLTIRIGCERRSLVPVQVADTGPGIAPARAETIFESYGSTKEAGLGIGLMICRTIIESHGGTIRLLPERSSGACFRFTVPVAGADD